MTICRAEPSVDARQRRLAAVGGALVVLALVLEVPAVVSQRDVPDVIDNLVMRIFPYPDRVAWFARHGMPDASQIDQAAADSVAVPGTAPIVGVDLQTKEFAALNTWISADGPSTYGIWLSEHPGFLLGAPFTKPPLAFNNANGDLGFYASTDRISTSLLDRILLPGLFGELAILAIALAFAWRRSVWRKEVWAVVVLGAIGPLSMLIAWQGDAQEVTRHMVEGSVETRLAILVFLMIAVLAPSTANESGRDSEPASPSGNSAAPDALPRVPEKHSHRLTAPAPAPAPASAPTPAPEPAPAPAPGDRIRTRGN